MRRLENYKITTNFKQEGEKPKKRETAKLHVLMD